MRPAGFEPATNGLEGRRSSTELRALPRRVPRGLAYAWLALEPAIWRSCLPSANSSTSLPQKAGRSSGLRLVTRPLSTTTSSSPHFAPALRRSVWSDGHEVIVRPFATPASISVHGPWQITATGLPCSKNERTNCCTSGTMRSWSGLPTPPGSTSASYSSALAPATWRSTLNVSALSKWLKALDLALLDREQLRCPAGLLDRLPRLGQLDLLDHVGGDERDALAIQLAGHASP